MRVADYDSVRGWTWNNPNFAGTRMIGVPICPDLLDYEAIGEADGMRGKVVRGFFWLMRPWKAGR